MASELTRAAASAPPCLFLKLGGSLLTDKTRPETLRTRLGQDLCRQMAQALRARPDLRLVLGIGAGSFGHVPARQYGLAGRAERAATPYGAAVTADGVGRLVRQVAAWLLALRVPAWVAPPGAYWRVRAGRLRPANADVIAHALAQGLVPIVHGDVMLDTARGVSIASTEMIFRHLAPLLRPTRLLLAGEVPGVMRDPARMNDPAHAIPVIRSDDKQRIQAVLQGSRGVDVTGGMASKVNLCLDILAACPSTSILIFDGRPANALREVLLGQRNDVGTRLVHADALGREPDD